MITGGVIYLIKKVFIFVLIFLLLFLIRMMYCQNLYMKDAMSQKGLEKIKAFEKVILFHFPFSPFTEKSIKYSLNECNNFKENKEKLYCYETLRSSLLQIRSFYQPYKDVIEELNPKIAHLRAIESIKWKYNNYSEKDYEKIYKNHLALLRYDNAPSVSWSAVVVFSLIGWIGSVFFIIFKALKTPFNKKYLYAGLTGYIIFFSFWLLGLWMA